jgi:hypothetical protein
MKVLKTVVAKRHGSAMRRLAVSLGVMLMFALGLTVAVFDGETVQAIDRERVVLGTVGPTPEPFTLTIRLHSCPDDLQATGFYQYQQRCVSEQGLYGVPLSFSQEGHDPSTIYSQPDDAGGALPIDAGYFNPFAELRVSEPVAFVTRDSVVFCSQHLTGNKPPSYDGTEIPWQDGAITFPVPIEGQVICDWYRFPGNVAAEPATDDPASPNTYHQMLIRTYVCPLGAEYVLPDLLIDATGNVTSPNPAPATVDLQGDLAVLQPKCPDAATPFAFHLTTAGGADQPMSIGGQDPLYTGWSNLAAGSYTIAEELPAGYATPVVLCEKLERGADGTDVKTAFIPTVNAGAITHDLAQYASLTCDWFNFTAAPAAGQQGLAPQDEQPAQDQPEGVVADDNETSADTDGDGLTDAEEGQYQTDPTSNDTDQDGLYDWDELNVYNTDPLNLDTDGDDADDGLEVYNGTDPLDPASS